MDGDDLRDVLTNKDYSEAGRRNNISTAISITKYLQSKNFFLVIVSLVSPYKDLRDDLKNSRDVLEVYLHTSQIRGKEDFVKDYQPPKDNFLDIDTGEKNIEECIKMKYSLFIGRWQPWHDGHRWLIDQRLKEGKNVCIAVRETNVDESNPFSTEEVIKNISDKLSDLISEGRIK